MANKLTLSEIRAISLEKGRSFFARRTLKFFGETMKNYQVRHAPDGTIYIDRRGGMAGDGTFVFDPVTGETDPIAKISE